MGNISNLATTGIYTFEKGPLKVTFNFVIDNETKVITRIEGGLVIENERNVADFYSVNYLPMGESERITMTLTKGREVELATAITEAVVQFEGKVIAGVL